MSDIFVGVVFAVASGLISFLIGRETGMEKAIRDVEETGMFENWNERIVGHVEKRRRMDVWEKDGSC